MTVKRIGGLLVLGALMATSLVALTAAPATAAKAEPSITAIGWWWEDAKTEQREVPGVGTVTLETPNPFCPSAGSGTGAPVPQSCAEGRLPIEVHDGDYETQNKISAVAFDFSLIPIGSEVNKFTVTFREAQDGCYEKDGNPDDNPDDDVCEETSPINVGDHKLQACLVTAYFGEGEARQYKEAPKYECTSADPQATRKEVDSNKDGEGSNFYWTFDLTTYAEKWASKFSAVTGVMLVGVPIVEGKGEDAQQDEDTWRVVLAGPKFENGIKTNLDFIPADDPLLPPTDPGIPVDPGTGFTDTGSGTGFTDTSGGTTDLGGTSDPGLESGDAAAPTPGASGAPVLSVGEPPEIEELPGYIWLALIAGLIGFSLVRSIVIEKTTGIRPDGVLSTIHRMNAERSADTVADAGSTGGLGSMIGQVFSKLNFRKKG